MTNRPTAFKAAKALSAETGTNVAAKTFGLKYTDALKAGDSKEFRYWAACYSATCRIAYQVLVSSASA